MKKTKIIIGRSDIIDLPELAITNIKAKVDTGAYTSAIHCTKPKVFGIKKKKISFYIFGRNAIKKKKFITEDFSEKDIKNSFGQIERRFIIKTKVLIFEKILEAEFSLSDRSNMRHPILLGRKFIKSRFLVDVSKINLSYKLKRKKRKLEEFNAPAETKSLQE